MGSTKDSRDLEDAAQNEKAAVIAKQGNALQLDIAPRSLTAPRSLLWEDGLLAAIPYTLNNGVDSYAPDAASMITSGPASEEAEERLTQAGQYGAAAKAGFLKLMSVLFQGGDAFAKQGLSALASVEGAVSSAARVIINAAKGDQTREVADEQTQEGYNHLAEKLLGISPVAVSSIASFIGAAVGKIEGKGAAGLVSLLMETGASALGTVTKNMLEGEEQPLSFLQTLSRLLMLRKAATGSAASLLIEPAKRIRDWGLCEGMKDERRRSLSHLAKHIHCITVALRGGFLKPIPCGIEVFFHTFTRIIT